MQNKVLKRLALNAKNRMISKSTGQTKKEGVYSPNVKFKVISGEDAYFFEKAKSVYERDEINPIGQLMDEAIFNKLDTYGKEKYLFDTIDKYNRFREKINREEQQLSV